MGDDGYTRQALLLGYRGFESSLAAATLATLRRIGLRLEGITEMDLIINRQGMTPNQAARA